MTFYNFTTIFEPEKDDKNIYNARIPALPGCFSFGDSLEEARYNICEAAELYLETLLQDGESIPKDKKIKTTKNSVVEELIVGVDFDVKTGFNSSIYFPVQTKRLYA